MGNNVFQSPFNITSAAINAALAGTVLTGPASINISASGYYAWAGRTVLKSTAAGVLALRDFAETISVEQVVEANDIIAQRRSTNPQIQRIYNTYTDPSNYERARIGWSGNIFAIDSQEVAGTGTNRSLQLAAGGTMLALEGSSGFIGYSAPFAFKRDGTSANVLVGFGGTGYTSTTMNFFRLTPSINQASGSYNIIDINPTETAIGAGPHYLIRGRIGAGGNVFSVSNTGAIVTNDNMTINGSSISISKRTDPAAPPANTGYFYLRDNGGGKMQFVARFPTGAIQVIATEP